jgi:large subunit ribosomal protein L13
MKTHSAKKGEIRRKWFVVDAEDAVLGRMSTQVASILKGKHTPLYTPSIDTGDFVIVVNADKVRLTGNKEEKKKYYRIGLQGKPGSLKIQTAKELRERRPEDLVRNAVRRMLPRNALGRQMFTKLKVYAGPEHPHEAQQPQVLEIQAR